MNRKLALIAPIALLALAGCAIRPVVETTTTPPEQPAEQTPESAPAPTITYETIPGREADTIEPMRAAPPPATPRIDAGTGPGDERALIARGYVRIGHGHIPFELVDREHETDARAVTMRQGQEAAADVAVLTLADDGWSTDYYVRFKLLFGATFRDLREEEKATFGSAGGVVIGKVVGGTPASRANLIGGDAVLAVDGSKFANRAEFQDLLKASAGKAVTLTIVRNGETLNRVVQLGAWSATTRE